MQKNYRAGGVGMMAAALGTYLVHAYLDDNQVELVQLNVLGWQVGADRTITPLVVDPNAVQDGMWHVIHPDGRVECADGRAWPDAESWINQVRRENREAA